MPITNGEREALKAAELLSRFVYSNIENDNLIMAMPSIRNSFRNRYNHKMEKSRQKLINV